MYNLCLKMGFIDLEHTKLYKKVIADLNSIVHHLINICENNQVPSRCECYKTFFWNVEHEHEATLIDAIVVTT